MPLGSPDKQNNDVADCIILGGSRGIGLATSIKLASAQKRILLTSSKRDTGMEAAKIIQLETGIEVPFLSGDLSSLSQVEKLADKIASTCTNINTLILCAGTACTSYEQTADGIERTFAVNHLAGFHLVSRLKNLLISNSPSNIIVVSSQIHAGGFLNNFVQTKDEFNGYRAYEESKLANILFTYELDRRLRGTGVRVNCLHPGVVSTLLIKNLYASRSPDKKTPQSNSSLDIASRFVYRIAKGIKWRVNKLFGKSELDTPESAAIRIAQLVLDENLADVSGKYFHSGRIADSKFVTYNENLAENLWDESEKLIHRSLA